jgi:Protein kinase domain/Domain of unknown function (DUF4384)
MGTVYLARDPRLDRAVAIKLIQAELDNADARERFVREARAIALLNHPNIVTVHDSDYIDSRPYFVLEYIEGRTLEAVIANREPVPVHTRLRWLEELCDGLQFAHEQGIIHRDIKPSNLMLDRSDRLRILDFGIAKIAGSSPTQASALIGTPAYMAPEYIRGEGIDHRVDLFAVGAVAYELLTFQRAFPGETHASVLHKVLQAPPAPLVDASSLAWPDPELERIVLHALEKDPGRRWRTARELRNAFGAVRTRVQQEQTPPDARGGDPTVIRVDQWAVEENSAAGAQTVGRPGPASARWGRAGLIVAGAVALAAAAVLSVTGFPQTSRSSEINPPPVAPPLRRDTAGGTKGGGPEMNDTVRRAAPELDTRAQGDRATTERVPPGGHVAKPNAVAAVAETLVPGAGRIPGASTPGRDEANATSPVKTATPVPGGPPAAAARAATLFYDAERGGQSRVGLRYRIVQRTCGTAAAGTCMNEAEREVDPQTTEFHNGDSIRLVFESNTDGYLYVVEEGTSGRWIVLFPDARINGGRNQIEKFKDYKIPSAEGVFTFNERAGTERLFVFLSKEPLAQLPGFQRPVSRTETLARADIDQLADMVRTRDLVFERVNASIDSSAPTTRPGPVDGNYVVNVEELGTAVTARFELIHK